MTESFTITRTLAAPPELVWDVWTKPEHFAVWFGTEAVEVPLDSVTLESVMDNLEVNAWAPFVLGRAFAGAVERGTIINLLDSRLSGYDWAHVGYFFSKQVLELMTRMMAVKFAPNITVNAVAPGLILPPPGEDARYLDQLIATVPLQAHGEPEDIADAIVFLAKSRYCTGEVIYVDGGRHLVEYARAAPPS